MRHASSRELFQHWNERRGRRPAPEREEIDPVAIRSILADTFILAFDPSSGHPFRLAGTRVCAMLGREVKGEAFLDLFRPETRSQIGDLVAIVASETVGMIASATETRADGLALELLLLPLASHGKADARVLGALAPKQAPDWLGARALSALALGSYRFLGDSGFGRMWRAGRTRPRLLVYDGGRC
jgi:hypothetical protein